MTKKTSTKTGNEIFEQIESCFDRHCSSGYNMKEFEVTDYEKELALLKNQKWIEVDALVVKLITMKNPDCSGYGLKSAFVRTGFNQAIDRVLVLLGTKKEAKKW